MELSNFTSTSETTLIKLTIFLQLSWTSFLCKLFFQMMQVSCIYWCTWRSPPPPPHIVLDFISFMCFRLNIAWNTKVPLILVLRTEYCQYNYIVLIIVHCINVFCLYIFCILWMRFSFTPHNAAETYIYQILHTTSLKFAYLALWWTS